MGDDYCYDEQFATLSYQLHEVNKNLEKIIELLKPKKENYEENPCTNPDH